MALAYSNAHKLYRIQPRIYNYTYGMVVRDIFSPQGNPWLACFIAFLLTNLTIQRFGIRWKSIGSHVICMSELIDRRCGS